MKRSLLLNVVAGCALLLSANCIFAQKDPGVRGGLANTGGGLEYRGIPIPHPPVISPNPTTGATINDNELASFEEGILRDRLVQFLHAFQSGKLQQLYRLLQPRCQRELLL